MRKRLLVLALVLIAVLTTCALVACGEGNTAEHDWEDYEVVSEATCTKGGVVIQRCSFCHIKQEIKTEALGHHLVSEGEDIKATCTKDGREASSYCDREGCDYEIEGKVIPALGHDLKVVPGSAINPTCEEDGCEATMECVRKGCDHEVEGEVITATGHAYGEWISVGNGTHKKVCANSTDCAVITENCQGGSATCEERAVCSICNGAYGDLVGHDYESVVTHPTCEDEGYTTYTCGTCGDTYVGDKTPALGHDYESVTTPATCLVDGLITYTCKNDSAHNYTEVIPALGHKDEDADNACDKCGIAMCTNHDWNDGVVTTEPSCEEAGVKTFTCTACGETKTEEVEAIGHTVVTDEAVDATCEETGLTEGSHCSVCNKVLVAQEVIEATGHTEVVDEAVDATCEETGLTEGKHCSVCGEVLVAQEEVAAKGHTEVVDEAVAPTCEDAGLTEGKHCSVCNKVLVAQEEVEANGHTEVVDAAVDATCEDTGLTEGKHCSVCGEVLVAQEVVSATGHAWNEGVVTTEPNCTEKGVKTFTCGTCGDTYTEEVEATGHDYDDGVVTTEPTCEEAGVKTFTCACGDTYTEAVDATGHDYDDGVVTTEPTCEEAGVKTFTCACGDTYTEAVDATGHDWNDGEVITEATCTAEGKKLLTCQNDTTHTMEESIAKIPHDFEDGVCKNCPASKVEKGVVFELGTNDPTKAGNENSNEVTTSIKAGTIDGYTLTLTNLSKIYDKCYDANGNYSIKMGSSKAVGSFTFTVPEDVTSVIIYAGQRAGNGTSIDVNGSAHTLSQNATAGAYDEIVIDTTNVKTITVTSGKSGDKRCFIGDIEFVVEGVCEHAGTEGVVTDPTCEDAGYTTYTCASCSHSWTVAGDEAIGHAWNEGEVITAPTCTDVGVKTYTCLHNAEHTKTEDVAIVEDAHSWNEGEVTTAPTCTDVGVKTYTCLHNAEHTKTEDVAIVEDAHIWNEGEVTTAPTCSSVGVKTYTCEHNAEHTYTEEVAIDENAHSYDSEVTTDPTCTEKGEKTYTCKYNAGHTYTEEVPALGHKDDIEDNRCDNCGNSMCEEHDWNDGEITTPATCEAKGVKTYTCKVCEDIMTEEVPATGHDYDDGVVTTEPTCTEKGVKTYTCGNDANHTYTEEVAIDENAHSWNEGEVTTAPTCTDVGVKTYTCLHNAEHTKTEEVAIDENAHSWNEGEVTTAPTCSSVGVKTYTCLHNAEHTYTEDVAIDENAHSWNEGVVTTPANCKEAGVKTFTCANDEEHTKTEAIDALGHDFTTGVCPRCHATKTEGTLARFDLGTNGSGYSENSTAVAATYTAGTVNGYTLKLTNASKVYDKYYDDEGNAGLKLGTSSLSGSFTFTVPADVTEVVFYVGQREAKATSVSINETNYVISSNGRVGAYDTIKINTTSVKTIEFKSGTTGDKRCVITAIEFNGVTICEHTGVTSETIAPTCTEAGYTLYTGTCGHSWTVAGDEATDHKLTAVEGKEATCSENGIIAHYNCENCGKNYTDETATEEIANVVIDKVDHTPAEAVQKNVQNATCTEDGSYESVVYCSVCNEELSREAKTIDALGHNFVDGVCDREDCGVSQCTEHVREDGAYVHEGEEHYQICDNCDVEFNRGNCSWDEGKVTTEPTCTEKGVKTYTCGTCNGTKTEEIGALGHTEVVDEAVDATCKDTGLTEGKHCSVCNEVLVAQDVIPATGEHTYTNGTCTVCGATISVQTATLNIYANKGSLSGTTTIQWNDTTSGISIINEKGSTAIRTSDSDHYRIYQGSTLKVTGSNITKVVFTATTSSYATVLQTSLNNSGYKATVSGNNVTVEIAEGTNEIKCTASAQTRINKVVVSYLG